MKSINKRVIFLIFLTCHFFSNPVFAAEEMNGKSMPAETAIIILSTNTVSEMKTARKIIEKNGGKIRSVFPPGVFIGTIARNISARLEEMDIIKEISYEKIKPNDYIGYESSVQDAIKFWNRKLDKISKPEEEEALKPDKEEPFRDDVIIPTDLPETREEKIKKDREYQERWKLKKEKLQGVDVLGAPAASVSAEFGEAYGAGYYDTSLYMAGDIAVGVFFFEGTDGAWILEDIDDFYITICDALDQFIDDEPNADISFTCIKEVDASGIPNPAPSSEMDYVNDLRNIYNTHWAFMITVTNESGRANANLFGPSTRLYSSYNPNSSLIWVVRHETMHIFGAMDQYCPDACRSPVDRWGYLNVVNANSQGNDGTGYFSGAGEGIVKDIMIINRGPIGVYSRGQIGWRDSDGDGIMEPIDTFPDTVILAKTGANPFTYTGRASDKPLLNDYKFSSAYGDVTLNTITRVEYSINGGAWSDTEPSDGAFDSAEEEFTFALPSLSDGSYTIEVRAINSVENTEVSHAVDEITIDGSSISNVRPFAAFSITPKKGSVETNFIFDASVSSDIEDDGSILQVRWDFEDDGIWDTGFSENKIASYNYSTAGTKTIRLEVKDSGGLTYTAARQVDVAAANIPSEAFFTVTPENRHGSYETFDVELNAAGSYDGEDAATALRVRWDFENDGVWDTDYSNTLSTTHSYELPRGLPATAVLDIPDYAEDLYVSGNYAYVVIGYEGLHIIDITDPAAPYIVGSIDTDSPGYAKDVYVSGNYAYVADGQSGLQVIDITDPTAPYIVGNQDTFNANAVYVLGNYAYVADAQAGLQVIDITNPAAPYIVGSSDTPGFANNLYVSGNYAYVTDPWLHVIDITDPAAPYIVGSSNNLLYAYGVYVSGDYAYIADGPLGGLQVIDITDPAAPYIVGNSDTPGVAQDIYVSGNYAYIADGISGGLQIIDITDPAEPYIIASSNILNTSARGVYVSGNYAYVADSGGSLWIIDITYPFKGEVLDKSTHWRAKLEVMDSDGNISRATRDMWAVTYNQPPSVDGIEFSSEAGLLTVRALGGTDPDIATTWDGLLEYRWDIDNDGVWDTEFTGSDTYVFVPPSDEYAVMCEVKDRFNATDRVVIAIAIDPNISASPASYDFGSVHKKKSSPPATFTIANTGSADLVIGGVYLTGTNPYQFSIRNDNCSGQTIASSGICTIEAVFSPTKRGTFNALIGIDSNDPDTPTFYVELTGTGVMGNKKN